MNLYRAILLVVFSFLYLNGSSQDRFSYNIETGINSSGLFNTACYSYEGERFSENLKPVIFPMVGISTKFKVTKHIYTCLGLQYFKVGTTYHDQNEYLDENTNSASISDIWEIQRFEKLSIPFSLGYDFKIGKARLNAFAGLRINYFTKGNYTFRTHTSSENPNIPEHHFEYTHDLLNSSELYLRSRWNKGEFIGLGMDIKKRFNLSMTYSCNMSLSYLQPGWNCRGSYYDNKDYTLILKYNLRKQPRRVCSGLNF